MQYYNLNKEFSTRSEHNLKLVQDYITSHPLGHRIFQGNFTNFSVDRMLMMLGCNISHQRTDSGKYAPHIEQVHVYENDAEDILNLINSLE